MGDIKINFPGMKNIFSFIILVFNFSSPAFLQSLYSEEKILEKLDSIRHSASVSRHFASVYYETTRNAIDFFSTKDQNCKRIIADVQCRFANLFLFAATAQKEGKEIPAEWKYYYSDSTLSPLQYLLIGINTHINDDIWQALTNESSMNKIGDIKASYFSYFKSLKRIYKEVYQEAFMASSKIRLLHAVTFGLDKQYGFIMLKRWRKRQFQLAELYFSNPQKFEQKLAYVKRKSLNTNHLIRSIL